MPVFHQDGLVGIDAYLPKEAIFLYPEEDSLNDFAQSYEDEAHLAYERVKTQHSIAVQPEAHLVDLDDGWRRGLKGRQQVVMPEVLVDKNDALKLRFQGTDELRGEILKASRSTDEDKGDVMAPLVQRLRQWRGDRLTTFIACHTRGQAERLKELLAPKKVEIRLLQQPFSVPRFLDSRSPSEAQQKGLTTLRDRSVHAWLVLGEVSGGFVLPDGHLAIISEEEIFGQRTKRRKRRSAAANEFVTDLKDLTAGDFVVHVDFGVGQYLGLTKLAVNGVDSDYLSIEYKGKDKLYLPVHRLRLISKYANTGEGRQPALDKLGGTAWANTKRKVKDTLLKMAAELIRLYAVRQTVEGQALPAPDEVFRQFEAEFPFDPTPDQAKAIEDVVEDMQKAVPMDRLICGDVGYGKTEVAMRAAMMAVMGGRQVVLLVPTTVLAAQHYQTFSDRF
ncbi:MAG: CarD family transcriptional regulator, partial [Myxococcota bacterium]